MATVAVLGLALAACSEAAASNEAAAVSQPAASSEMSVAASQPGENQVMTVYATPTCGCCKGWMDHMREHGFTVEVVYQNDLTEIRRQHGVPAELTSCHMGVVDGYAVEGHVPADVVTRMLRERPDAFGIAVPGMPAGSPGMEMPNGLVQPYEVYTFDASGPKAVYEYSN